MYRLISIAAGNTAGGKVSNLGSKHAGNPDSNTKGGAVRSRRAGEAIFQNLGCPHYFTRYGFGSEKFFRCDYCGTQLDHEPGDPTVWS